MKRSHKLKLSLMVPMGMMLTACGEAPPPEPEVKLDQPKAYKSVEDCINGGVYTETACQSAYENALKQTPKFEGANGQMTCEEKYGPGNCVRREGDSGDWFAPALMGYMVGNMMSGNSYSGYNHRVIYEPIYRDRKNHGDFTIGSTSAIQSKTATVSTLNQKAKASYKSTYGSKSYSSSKSSSWGSSSKSGGFGSSSSFRGSFGG